MNSDLANYKAPEGHTFLYILTDPDTSEICYAGQTRNPKVRLEQHSRDLNNYKNAKGHWIYSLHKRGKIPVMTVIGLVGVEQAPEAEKKLVAILWRRGHPLLNSNLLLSYRDYEACQAIRRRVFDSEWIKYVPHLRSIYSPSFSNN